MTSDTSTPASRVTLPVLAAAVTVVLWASAFVGVRAAGHDYSPGALALGRQIVGSLALTVVVLVVHRGRIPRLPRGRTLLGVVAWGVGWFGVYNLALNAAEQHLDAGTTALLVNIAPALVAVFAGLLLGEGFPRRLLFGILVAFSGVAIIAATTSTGQVDTIGVVLGLAAAVLYAGGALSQKRLLARVDAVTMTWVGCLAGTIACLPFAPALVVEAASAPIESTAAIVYLGIFPTAIAFTTWGYALSRTTAGRLASTTYLVPPLAILISWALLGEAPPLLSLVGGVLCLAGVAIATLRRPARPASPRASA